MSRGADDTLRLVRALTDITRIRKIGAAYLVEGVIKGKGKASFWAHAADVEAMTESDFREWCLIQLQDCIEAR